MEIVRDLDKEYITDTRKIDFKTGDTVIVGYRIQEGAKSRIQKFQGVVIQRKGSGMGASFTVRKIAANGIGVERIFPLNSSLVDSLEVVTRGKVRQSRIYFMRERTGKSARLREVKSN